MKAQIVHGTLISYDQEAAEAIAKHAHLEVVDFKIVKSRKGPTNQQIRATHKFCDMLALSFNAAGIAHEVTLPSGHKLETSWTLESVKRDIWYGLQYALFGHESIKDLERTQINEIYEIINRDIAAPQGVFVPFPRWEDMAT